MAMTNRQAQVCYNTITQALDNMGWKYTEDNSTLRIKYDAYGEDLCATYIFAISAEKETVTLTCTLPYRAPRHDRGNFAKAMALANSRFYNGSFEFNPQTREVLYRMTTFLKGGMSFSVEAATYMIDTSCDTVDKYNDKFLAVGKGYLTLDQFISLITKK